MIQAGFELARLERVEQVLDSKIGSAVWSDPFLEKNSTSQLILLADEQYQQGLERIKAALSEADAANQKLIFPVDLVIDMLVARKSDK